MARRIQSRIKIKGKLKAQTPLHFGGNEIDPDTDLALAVNGRGNYYLAGTNLTGLLREWMFQTVENSEISESETVINNLWGFQEGDTGHASHVLVEDGEITLPDGLTTEIRDHVGINRQWGTAADRQKYDRQVVPKGSTIDLNLTLEISDLQNSPHNNPNDLSQTANLLAQLLQDLKDKKQGLRIGGGKTRGLGKVQLVNLEISEQRGLLEIGGILDALRDKWPPFELEPSRNIIKSPQLKITVQWKPINSMMMKAEGEGIAVDILPLVSGNDRNLSLVMAGSSIKGILRSQAEKIVRTVSNLDLPDQFLTQVQVDLVKTLFGNAASIDTGKQQGYQGALAIDDCYSETVFSAEQWDRIVNAKDSKELTEFIQTLEEELSSMQQAYHVAIDRWTGGAADGALYSVLEPMGIQWHPLELTLDLKRLKRKEADSDYLPRIALLFLVLRDLMNRRIPIGFGTNRGMGDITVQEISFEGMNSITELDNPEDDGILNNEELLEKLTKAWQDWMARKGVTA